MNTIEVSKLKSDKEVPPMIEVSTLLDELGEGHSIGTINWQSHLYKPSVRFNIAWGDREIYIKYYVRESCVKAEKSRTNEMVCEDSCVEFFVSPSDDGIYYNLEFNPIGTGLMGAGHGRTDSVRADPAVVEGIRKLATMGDRPFSEITGDIGWSLTLAIPLSTFFHHRVENLAGKSFRANFYKCGDKLSTPHYITWNPIGTEKPDYHQPAFFGILKFIQ
jgi:hypothetical protein